MTNKRQEKESKKISNKSNNCKKVTYVTSMTIVKIAKRQQFQLKVWLIYAKCKKLKLAFIAAHLCNKNCKISPQSC